MHIRPYVKAIVLKAHQVLAVPLVFNMSAIGKSGFRLCYFWKVPEGIISMVGEAGLLIISLSRFNSTSPAGSTQSSSFDELSTM